jgi:DNA invertase Pin-like site-specific DNA recombinase
MPRPGEGWSREGLGRASVSSVGKREALATCLGFLRAGDALVVTKPDRLARNTAELLSIDADLSRRGVGLVVLSVGGERLDTRNPTSKLMLTILGGVATWEREIMLERQREGIGKAREEGKYKGRGPSIDAAVFRARVATGEKPAQVARSMGVARSSVYRMLSTAPATCLLAMAFAHSSRALPR